MKDISKIALFLVGILLGCCGCSDNGTELSESITHSRDDIVTYLGNDGSGARFEYLGREDSAAITLLSTAMLDSSVLVNHRILLRYDFADNSTGSERRITAYGYSKIFSDSLRYNVAPLSYYGRHPIRLRSIWRTGSFINLHCQVEYSEIGRQLYLMADSATLYADTIECYLVHSPLTTDLQFWRDCYASFNIDVVWKRPQCRAMRVYINDEIFEDIDTYLFTKK